MIGFSERLYGFGHSLPENKRIAFCPGVISMLPLYSALDGPRSFVLRSASGRALIEDIGGALLFEDSKGLVAALPGDYLIEGRLFWELYSGNELSDSGSAEFYAAPHYDENAVNFPSVITTPPVEGMAWIMRSPDGSRWKLSVNNDGQIVREKL